MEDAKNRQQIPAFGSWNYSSEVPIITRYFDSVRETGLIQAHLFGGDGEDLFKVVLPQNQQHQRKRKNGGRGREGMERRKPKPADEDLYKVPPELLYQAPRKKKVLRNLGVGCLGLNCIA